MSLMLIRKRTKKTVKLTKVMIYVIIIEILNCFSFYFNFAGSNIIYEALLINNSHLNTSNVNAISRNMGDTCTRVTNTLMTCNPFASSYIKHTIIMRETAVQAVDEMQLSKTQKFPYFKSLSLLKPLIVDIFLYYIAENAKFIRLLTISKLSTVTETYGYI